MKPETAGSTSKLTGREARMLIVLAAGFGLLLVNGLFLMTVRSVGLFAAWMIILHLAVGVAVLAAAALFTVSHLWSVRAVPGRRSLSISLLLVSSLLLLGGSGLFLAIEGATTGHRWVLTLHLLSIPLCLLVALLHAKPRLSRRGFNDAKTRLQHPMRPGLLWTGAAASFVAGLFLGLALLEQSRGTDGIAFEVSEPRLDPKFTPSAARTVGGHLLPDGALSNPAYCGGCHKEIYKQWQSSMHHFSSFNNPFYRKTTLYSAERKGMTTIKWCAGCHDPALLFTGRLDEPDVDVTSDEAKTGLSCLACHAVQSVPNVRGNGGYVIDVPVRYPWAASDSPLLQSLNRLLIYAKPAPHREAMIKPIHRTAEFCAACHKVGIPEEVNDYRFLRGQDEYDHWQNSGVSGNSSRSFYYPRESKRCQDCHMPLVKSDDPAAARRGGWIRSHRFAAANSAIPHLNGDREQLEQVTKFLQDGKVSVDILGVKRTGGDDMLIAPLDRLRPPLRPGDDLTVEVVVRTRGVGHTFPGGTIDSNEVWVEFTAVDGDGRRIYASGEMNAGGKVDPAAHFYRAVTVDRHANVADKRNVPIDMVATVYARVIPPGAADVAHYRIRLPAGVRGPVTLTARLRYRKFSRAYTDWVYAGRQLPSTRDRSTRLVDDSTYVFDGSPVPDLPVIDVAADSVVLPVGEKAAQGSLSLNPSPVTLHPASPEWERFNDYGIGLLRQGDLRGAEAAFQRVAELQPDGVDGPVNLARTALRDGDLETARRQLDRALTLSPDNATARYFLADVDRDEGRYDDAIGTLQRVLERYPRDRVAMNELGELYFLQGRFKEAAALMAKTLAIDPEDVDARYLMMRTDYALGDRDEAARQRALYLKYKTDESAPAVAARYRLTHPYDNDAAQPAHVHE
ncbi:MAG TPA: tetratricopeptide repeat protein [Nitrospiria bacterium]|nr:tetratricopeptide repeat protein [Nitrospiria bacterium]